MIEGDQRDRDRELIRIYQSAWSRLAQTIETRPQWTRDELEEVMVREIRTQMDLVHAQRAARTQEEG